MKKTAAETRGKTKHAAAVATQTSGRAKAVHRASPQGQQRADVTYSYGSPDLFPTLSEDVKLRWWALLSTGGRFELEHVESCTWQDNNAITQGSLVVREQGIIAGSPDVEYRLDQGDRIVLEASEDGRPFREVWTMRVYRPQLTASNGQRTFDLVNDLDLLRQSEDNFLYTTDKAHPHGWTGQQIVVDLCEQYKVPLGGCYTSSQPIGRKLRWRRASPLAVLQWILVHEHRKFRRRLVLRWDRGKLYILPLQRSGDLLRLGPTLVEAAFQSALPPQFASSITLHGLAEYVFDQTSAGFPVTKRQKMHVQLGSAESQRRFGYVHRIVWSGHARTDAELRKEGEAYLAAVMQPHKTLTLTHQGMPFVRRGDAIQLALGDQGLRKQVVYVNEAQHRATPDSYQMDLGVIFDDPYIDRRAESIIYQLKATHDEAVGNRNVKNRFWYLPKNNKGDAAVTSSAPFAPVDPSYGGSIVLNPATPTGGPFGGG